MDGSRSGCNGGSKSPRTNHLSYRRPEKQFGDVQDELLGQQVATIIPEGFAERLVADSLRSAAEALTQQIGTGIELTGRRKDGSEFPIEIMLSPLKTDEGLLVTAAIRDITLRRLAESKITDLNRIYAMLSAINGLMVRVRNRETLFREACRITVDVGGFSGAWVGVANEAGTKVNIIASAGVDQAFISRLNERYLLSEDAPFGNSLAARAIREDASFVSNDPQTDTLALLRDTYPASAASSIVVLPLIVHGEALGMLELYSG
ncbi:MAG: PAS domain S-box protein [Halioglobus sp.]|nr:PAS domain S-box protein [Halioglobus sp.]